MNVNYPQTNYFLPKLPSLNLIGLFVTILFTIGVAKIYGQGISSGVNFNWQDTQTNIWDQATLESIDINGENYNTFVVPSSYEMTRVGPGGHSENHIWSNGAMLMGSSNDYNWDLEAINAYQSLNLNHYFESNSNGVNFCENYGAAASVDTQIQTISYNPGIPSNPDGVLAVTERGGNNCQYLEIYGIPANSSTEVLLGATFVRSQGNLTGIKPQSPPLPNSDYWSSGRNNDNGQIIGIALFKLSDLAPVGSIITSIKYLAATTDNGDGKFFLMQTYAVDDYFETNFKESLNANVATNDNLPDFSTYSLLNDMQPLYGSVTVETDGTFMYTPNNDFKGMDQFEVQVCLPYPNEHVCETSTVIIKVREDNKPNAQDDHFLIVQNTADIALTILDNDTFGVDGPNANLALEITSSPSNGILAIGNNGTPLDKADDYFVYTPNADFIGSDDFTYTIIDGNGTRDTATVTLTVIELPSNVTVEVCNPTPAADYNPSSGTCPIDTVLTESINGNNDNCPTEYVITRNWTFTDCVGNIINHEQVITIVDTTAPTFVEPLPQNETVTCDKIPYAETLTAIDSCESDIMVNYTETISIDGNCATGYEITRMWIASDCAGNTETHTQTITVIPNGPIMASPYEEQVTILCGDEIPEVPNLTFTGGCGNYSVDFNEQRENADDSEDYMIVRSWNVIDLCGNTALFEQFIFVMQPQLQEVTIELCIEDEAIDLINYLPFGFKTDGTFNAITQGTQITGSIFDPMQHQTQTYVVEYSSTSGECNYFVDFTIAVNNKCVPCSVDNFTVSKAVTANADGFNDFFEIKGTEFCDNTFDVMIFNRWGNKVFEAKNYQNNWGGSSPNNSLGNSGYLPTGTYYYIINLNGEQSQQINGYIYLGSE